MKIKNINLERTPQEPPIIHCLSDAVKRTKWSVMIPVYNCISYLPITLKSVLDQNKRLDEMQIKVLDDGSTDGDVEILVQEIGKGRIEYFRHPKNIGSLRNFEAAINQAIGEYIHILHGDDAVKPGFYDEIEGIMDEFSDVGAAFTSFEYMDDNGDKIWDIPEISTRRCVLPNWLETIASKQVIQPPAMVVKRSTYEQIGGFYGVHYGEDWLMWVRIAANYKVAYSPKILAKYRVHNSNISFRLFENAQNIREINFVINEIRQFLPQIAMAKITNTAKKNFSIYYARLSHKIYHEYNRPKVALYQAIFALKLHLNFSTINYSSKLIFKYFIGYCYLKKIYFKLYLKMNKKTTLL